ncbi:membrane lipoprotein lipid attachment site-containing protein [Neorhizobium sp. CSC1952]|uniref:Uncharacterized protein n=1 Tax=Xaviernesmea oryzae TaxID=464029 RepID=A0A1X7D402_9HYPH|nr:MULTISPECIES: membrane lipoprotein lipid attachment site-containing protein [Rhizobium/Agrobacterium group]WJR65373.1 membrane lipoprotein lipid attachment site-containing protein [Rhizobium sp. CSC1952]SMF08496.1 hypothetical protein SAMN02982989_5003 [Xaviernesmea oryzae]
MKRLIIALSAVLLLSACGDSGENQSDPVNNTPQPQPENTAPADRSSTPQTGTGGPSPANPPSGNTSTPPAGSGNP